MEIVTFGGGGVLGVPGVPGELGVPGVTGVAGVFVGVGVMGVPMKKPKSNVWLFCPAVPMVTVVLSMLVTVFSTPFESRTAFAPPPAVVSVTL